MTTKIATVSAAVCVALAMVLLSTRAHAGEDDGRLTHDNLRHATCADLYTIRNGIYGRAGYCFKTDRARVAFGQGGCRFTSIGEVPLSPLDQSNVALLRAIEKTRGCR